MNVGIALKVACLMAELLCQLLRSKAEMIHRLLHAMSQQGATCLKTKGGEALSATRQHLKDFG